MKSKDFLAKISSFGFFYRWHPEVALRYLPVVDEIKKLPKDISILEVGSGGLGIAPYLKREVTGVDIEFTPPFYPLLKKVRASAIKLPFTDNSFDVVVSVDMLEHLPKKERKTAIFEMIRVGKRKIIIGVPTGKKALEQDRKLNKTYQKIFGKKFEFLEEQVNFGLPKVWEISDIIKKGELRHKKRLKIKIVGNENLLLREFLMRGWMTKNFFLNIFFRKIMLLFIPILKRINHHPTYRTLYFVDIL